MADMVTQHDIGSLITARMASSFAALTAGQASNAAAITGLSFQRTTMGLPRNAALLLAYTAALGAGNTLSLGTVKIQDSVDGVAWADYLVFANPGAVATGPTGGGTVEAEVTLKARLSGARDFVRVLFTPTLSAAGTDTATVVAVLVFAGFERLPAPL